MDNTSFIFWDFSKTFIGFAEHSLNTYVPTEKFNKIKLLFFLKSKVPILKTYFTFEKKNSDSPNPQKISYRKPETSTEKKIN